MRRILWIFSALALLLPGIPAFAQRDLGTIVGTVLDAQGAAIPDVKLTITEDATGLSYTTMSSGTGEFTRPALKPGTGPGRMGNPYDYCDRWVSRPALHDRHSNPRP